ncbi:LptF/LptG family permease [Sediminitomix flava]|uniref:Lipopolysaccharide export system permease protein n=1 Tax=Sediminitomix flava TaxID=379075 RepID=A0A315Z9T9_SEDFL|nr:LptF/LptG family permease [Sediminitomix flava]PWJ42042.1 lipopolysaccharide export system permease protein [Sediminitomix flava]
MKILDRYILGKYFKTFLFVVFLLAVIILAVDYTEKSDDFIKNNLSFGQVMSDYYVYVIIHWLSTLSPISVFIAVVFFTANLAQHTEIVAMLNGGMSYRRLIQPYLIGSVLLALLTFVNVGWLVPKAAEKKVEFEKEYIKSKYYFSDRDIHLRVSDSSYLYMESYNNNINRGYRFTLETIDSLQLKEKITSDRIEWDSTKQMWHVKKYTTYSFEGEDMTISKGKDLDLDLNVKPKYFQSRYKLEETLTIPELNDFIASEKARGVAKLGKYSNAIQERYAYPFAMIILTILGVVISSRKTRGGSGLLIAVGFLLAFAYILMVIMSRSFADAGSLSPVVAAWMPNVICSAITAALYYNVPK